MRSWKSTHLASGCFSAKQTKFSQEQRAVWCALAPCHTCDKTVLGIEENQKEMERPLDVAGVSQQETFVVLSRDVRCILAPQLVTVAFHAYILFLSA